MHVENAGCAAVDYVLPLGPAGVGGDLFAFGDVGGGVPAADNACLPINLAPEATNDAGSALSLFAGLAAVCDKEV